MQIVERLVAGYEKVVSCRDPESGLHAVIGWLGWLENRLMPGLLYGSSLILLAKPVER